MHDERLTVAVWCLVLAVVAHGVWVGVVFGAFARNLYYQVRGALVDAADEVKSRFWKGGAP